MDDGLNTVLLRGTVAEVKARTFLLAVGTRTFELHLDGLSGQDVQAGDNRVVPGGDAGAGGGLVPEHERARGRMNWTVDELSRQATPEAAAKRHAS